MKLNWGTAIFIFFTIFVALSIVFIIFSFNQDIELVEDDYYNKGANYTQQMEVNQRSRIFFDSISITNTETNLLLTLPQALFSHTDTLKLYFYNPSSKSKDYKLLLTNLNDSVYFDKTQIQPGHYIVKINWQITNLEFLVEKRLNIN